MSSKKFFHVLFKKLFFAFKTQQKSGRDDHICATSKKLELSVKPTIFLLQIYFGGIRRGSEKVLIHGTEKL